MKRVHLQSEVAGDEKGARRRLRSRLRCPSNVDAYARLRSPSPREPASCGIATLTSMPRRELVCELWAKVCARRARGLYHIAANRQTASGARFVAPEPTYHGAALSDCGAKPFCVRHRRNAEA